jgi:hypothetical protein
VIHKGSISVKDHSALETSDGSGTRREITATYHIWERNLVVERGMGFLAWLIAKATFQKQETSRPHSYVDDRDSQSMEDDIEQSSRKLGLSLGESKVLI